MRFKVRSDSLLRKKARKGFRGYPAATVAYYGPDDQFASKVAVGIVTRYDAGPDVMERWFAADLDVRDDPLIEREILDVLARHGVKSVAVTRNIIGCPHETPKDYPEGEVCPYCPFWANRPRFAGLV